MVEVFDFAAIFFSSSLRFGIAEVGTHSAVMMRITTTVRRMPVSPTSVNKVFGSVLVAAVLSTVLSIGQMARAAGVYVPDPVNVAKREALKRLLKSDLKAVPGVVDSVCGVKGPFSVINIGVSRRQMDPAGTEVVNYEQIKTYAYDATGAIQDVENCSGKVTIQPGQF